jgi:molecular chaperone DnaK (HSP70)
MNKPTQENYRPSHPNVVVDFGSGEFDSSLMSLKVIFSSYVGSFSGSNTEVGYSAMPPEISWQI